MLIDTKVIFKGEQIIRNYPINITENDTKYYECSLTGFCKETTISTFKNVTINNELFIKDNFKFRILKESFGDVWQDKLYNRNLYLTKNYIKNLLRKSVNIKEAIWCFDQFSTGGYYHWITEICPRLWLANEFIDSSIPLLVPEYFFEKWGFSNSFFEPFNRKIIKFKENELVNISKLIFIGQTGGVFNFQPISIHSSTLLLKNHYLNKNKNLTKPLNKIYISRNKSRKRTIINEDELLPILNEHGFKVIHTEDLEIQQQIELFSQTSHLLSIHGAGLTNLVFMPPNSKVIEIRHEEINHMLNCFHTLAHTFNIDYYYIFGNNKGDTLPNENRPEDKSIHVNIEMLKYVLSNLK